MILIITSTILSLMLISVMIYKSIQGRTAKNTLHKNLMRTIIKSPKDGPIYWQGQDE